MVINLEEMPRKISELVAGYSEKVRNEINQRIDRCATEILDYLKTNIPKSSNAGQHLADSFIKTEVGDGEKRIIYISSKNKYRIVHLVELGFRHVSGKHISARPFLRPAFDTLSPKMMEDIKRIIAHGPS